MFKGRILSVIFVVFLLSTYIHSQSNRNAFYLGAKTGFSFRLLEASIYLFCFGTTALYNWNRSFVSFGFNVHNGLNINFGDEKPHEDNSKYHRYELIYGRSFQLSKTHKFFKHISITPSMGVSYSRFNYYEDHDALENNHLSKLYIVGIPFGMAITNKIGKRVFGGIDYKFHIYQELKPHFELSAFIMVNVL